MRSDHANLHCDHHHDSNFYYANYDDDRYKLGYFNTHYYNNSHIVADIDGHVQPNDHADNKHYRHEFSDHIRHVQRDNNDRR